MAYRVRIARAGHRRVPCPSCGAALPAISLQWVAGHKARQKEVDRDGEKECKAEFKRAAGKVFHLKIKGFVAPGGASFATDICTCKCRVNFAQRHYFEISWPMLSSDCKQCHIGKPSACVDKSLRDMDEVLHGWRGR